jgi:hypothetical protein
MMAPRERWQGDRRVDLSAREFHQLFREVANWGRWSDRAEVGALNYLSAERVVDPARLVRRVLAGDLEAAEQAQGVRVEVGDVLLVRTGHARRLAELEPWDTSKGKVGLHPSAARFLADGSVAALGSDGNNDTAPSTTERVALLAGQETELVHARDRLAA